jgi:uncharacterized protein YciI
MLALGLVASVAVAVAAAEAPAPPAARYVFGFLRRGPSWTAERTARTDSLQRGHLENIGRMAEEGVLIGAGPFADRGDPRGVFIFRPDSISRIRALAERDPAIRAGRLVLELRPWSGPPGIGEPYRRLAARPGHRDSMVRLWLGTLGRGPRWTSRDTDSTRRLEQENAAYLRARLAAGDYAAVGGFEDDLDPLAVVIVRGDSAGAHELVAADPAVRAGRLVARIRPWLVGYGVMPGDTL